MKSKKIPSEFTYLKSALSYHELSKKFKKPKLKMSDVHTALAAIESEKQSHFTR